MWQLEIDAPSASSGSMFAGFENGAGTTAGAADAGTLRPPSKLQVCSRVYLPRRKSGVPPFHSILALCCDMRSLLAYLTPDRQQSLGRLGGTTFLSQQRAFGPCTPGRT